MLLINSCSILYAKVLLAAGAKTDVTNEFGSTPLKLASGFGYLQIVKVRGLLESLLK